MPANQIKVTDKMAAVALDIFTQTSYVAANSVRSYEDEFSGSAKIGDSVRIKNPSKYNVQFGNNRAQPQAVGQTPKILTLDQNPYVEIALTSQELAVFTGTDVKAQREIMEQGIANLARNVDTYMFGIMNQTAMNQVARSSTTGVSYKDLSVMNSRLGGQLCPKGDRHIAACALDLSQIQQSISTLYNPDKEVEDAYMDGVVGTGLGFSKWLETESTGTQSIGTMTSATTSAAVTVEGSISIPVTSTTGTLKAGQAFTCPGCYQIDPQTLTGKPILYTFVAAADVPATSTAIPIVTPIYDLNYPLLNMRNISALPGSGATITPIESQDAGKLATNIMGWHKKAVALACMDLPTDLPGAEASKLSIDGLSIRIIRQYTLQNNAVNILADMQYGGMVLRPEWMVNMTGFAQ